MPGSGPGALHFGPLASLLDSTSKDQRVWKDVEPWGFCRHKIDYSYSTGLVFRYRSRKLFKVKGIVHGEIH